MTTRVCTWCVLFTFLTDMSVRASFHFVDLKQYKTKAVSLSCYIFNIRGLTQGFQIEIQLQDWVSIKVALWGRVPECGTPSYMGGRGGWGAGLGQFWQSVCLNMHYGTFWAPESDIVGDQCALNKTLLKTHSLWDKFFHKLVHVLNATLYFSFHWYLLQDSIMFGLDF